MNDKKQIEDIADILCQSKNHKCDGEDCKCIKQATDLYNAKCRILPEDSVVLTREEYKSLTNELDKGDYGEFESGYAQASKETARGFAEKLKSMLFDLGNIVNEEDIDELLKEFNNENK